MGDIIPWIDILEKKYNQRYEDVNFLKWMLFWSGIQQAWLRHHWDESSFSVFV